MVYKRTLILFVLCLFSWEQVKSASCPDGTSLDSYSGNERFTDGGRHCQRWYKQMPHPHSFNTDDHFPLDRSLDEAEEYCRKFADEPGPWCYTTDPYVPWQYCYARICGMKDGTCGGFGTMPAGPLIYVTKSTKDSVLYNQTRDCSWRLHAPKNTRIQFVVLSIDVPPPSTKGVCDEHYLQIYEPAVYYGKFCQNDARPIVNQTKTSTLNIRFYSGNIGAGFSATISYVTPKDAVLFDPDCGELLTDSEGWLASPDRDGDNQYDVMDDCIWTLTTTSVRHLQIEAKVVFMDIRPSPNCSEDFLEIYERGVHRQRYCGNMTPTVISSAPKLVIRFHSDNEFTAEGFRLEYRHVDLIAGNFHTTHNVGTNLSKVTAEPVLASTVNAGSDKPVTTEVMTPADINNETKVDGTLLPPYTTAAKVETGTMNITTTANTGTATLPIIAFFSLNGVLLLNSIFDG